MTESAPEGRDEPIPEAEALARVQALPVEFDTDEDSDEYTTLEESDRTLHSVLYTGGSTEYAHIYLAWITGEYNGNRMLFLRYVWLSKPGAYESDMWGENGMNIRLVEGMPNAFSPATVAAMQGAKQGRDGDPNYFEVGD
jgi:hypothetical protein